LLFQYQKDAYSALKGKHRTVLQMACGTGKTLVSILLAKDYKQNIIISPLKAYCEQNLERFKSQMPKSYGMLIIDSDNDGRNIDNITEFIKKNPKIGIFVTYKSIDIIKSNEIIRTLKKKGLLIMTKRKFHSFKTDEFEIAKTLLDAITYNDKSKLDIKYSINILILLCLSLASSKKEIILTNI
jgi:superfamily II DNA or RNA helicase